MKKPFSKSCWPGVVGIVLIVIALATSVAFTSGEWEIALKHASAFLSCYFMGLMVLFCIFGTIQHFTGGKDFDDL